MTNHPDAPGSGPTDPAPEPVPSDPQAADAGAAPGFAAPQAPPPPVPSGPAQPLPLPPGAPPGNNLGWAIASILLCWPFAIPSLIKSLQVDTLWMQGRPDLAQLNADEAKKWGKIGVIVGCCLWGLYVVFFVAYFVFIFGMIGFMGVRNS